MDTKVTLKNTDGKISAIPSKSDVHRALICAALADRESRVNFACSSQDIDATISCLVSLGAEIKRDGGGATVVPIKEVKKNILLDCGESGSTIRFMLPVAAALGAEARFTGHGRLSQRPLEPLARVMEKNGCEFSRLGEFPLKVGGELTCSRYEIRGDVSSQYITGLLLSLPIFGRGGKITVIPPIESEKYIDMTVDTMRKYGIDIKKDGNVFSVPSGSFYKVQNCVYSSDGDWSNAAFFLCAAAINGNAKYEGVYKNSLQGDKKIVSVLKNFGANVTWGDDFVSVSSSGLKGIDIDASQIPDLVPVLAVTAAFAEGKTKIYNAARLRIKESDRLAAITNSLQNIGAEVKEYPDALEIIGSKNAKYQGTVDSFNDHRIVMSMAVASSNGGSITIKNAEAVNKSYPSFFEDFKLLGGKCDVLQFR